MHRSSFLLSDKFLFIYSFYAYIRNHFLKSTACQYTVHSTCTKIQNLKTDSTSFEKNLYWNLFRFNWLPGPCTVPRLYSWHSTSVQLRRICHCNLLFVLEMRHCNLLFVFQICHCSLLFVLVSQHQFISDDFVTANSSLCFNQSTSVHLRWICHCKPLFVLQSINISSSQMHLWLQSSYNTDNFTR